MHFSANRSGFNPTITLVYNSVQKYAKIAQKSGHLSYQNRTFRTFRTFILNTLPTLLNRYDWLDCHVFARSDKIFFRANVLLKGIKIINKKQRLKPLLLLSFKIWARRDSNPRPKDYESSALPLRHRPVTTFLFNFQTFHI